MLQILRSVAFTSLDCQRVEAGPRVDLVDANPHPVHSDALGTLDDGASAVRCESFLHVSSFVVHVREECCCTKLRLDEHVGMLEVGATAKLRDVAVHDHRGYAAAMDVGETCAASVAMRTVLIRRFRGVQPTSKVLDGHDILLSFDLQVVANGVVGVVVQPPHHGGDRIALMFFVPWNTHTSLHGLADIGQSTSARSVSDCATMQFLLRGILDGLAFLGRDEVLDGMDLA
mmetsp:Transcript_2137/g.5935  ORF Transcript_2137/g.5935 Transcript_2137/m.5935 type:complete len:230 (+) Transcript_2137:1472-2161(+)